jgi:hypothetical protein
MVPERLRFGDEGWATDQTAARACPLLMRRLLPPKLHKDR